MQDKIKVLMIEPGKAPYLTEIGGDLKSMQEAVGGLIELVYLGDESIAVCNEEGKLIGLEGNRRLDWGDIIAGPFFICCDGGEDLISVSDQVADKYMERFQEVEKFTPEEVEECIRIETIGL